MTFSRWKNLEQPSYIYREREREIIFPSIFSRFRWSRKRMSPAMVWYWFTGVARYLFFFGPGMVLQNEFSSFFIIFGCFWHQNWQSCWLLNYFSYYPQKIITSFFLFPNHAWRLQVLFIHFTQIFREPTAVSYGWAYPTLSRIRTWRRWSKHLLLGWT